VDEVAALLDEDAAAFRHRHLRGPADPGGEALAALGEPAGRSDARPIAELLRVGGQDSGPPRRWRAQLAGGPLRVGRGVGVARGAAGPEGHAGAPASVRLLDDGSFTLAAGAPAMGGSDEVAYAEAAAAILGVPPALVVCAAADTDSAPFEPGDASPADFTAGQGVEEAARIAREHIREAGAALLSVPPEQATVGDGVVRDGTGRSVTFAEIGAAALRAGQPLTVTAAPLPPSTPPSLATAFADAEVDAETGIVRVTRLSAAVAGGPFGDPRTPEGQVEGALASALEQSLAGGLLFDADGRPLARSLRRWPFVTALDVPPLLVTFLPAGDRPSRFGTAALGEAAARAALAAIVNAVSRAAGGRLRDLPLTPERVLAAVAARARP
jgi:xanthine dehydrogenase molybdenum-binding subunit